MTKFIIIGSARHGKTTFGRILAEQFDCFYLDTSAAVIAVESLRQHALCIDHLPECWDEERERPTRSHLVALGDAMQQISPTVFVDYVFDRAPVCIGVRRRVELAAAKRKYPDAVVIYVVRAEVSMGHDGDNFNIPIQDAHRCYAFCEGDLPGMRDVARDLWREYGPQGAREG